MALGATSKPKSHGLVGMRERMRQIGGAIEIRPNNEGTGTVVDAFIPTQEMPKAQSPVGADLHAVGGG
jgi:signal transduction histidine kinase